MFLLEKLPRDSAQAADEPMGRFIAGGGGGGGWPTPTQLLTITSSLPPGTSVLLGRAIAAELAQCRRSPWTPSFCKDRSTAWSGEDWWLEVRGCSYYHSTSGVFKRSLNGLQN